MRCPQCDIELKTNQSYCPKCGISVDQVSCERQERDRVLAERALGYKFPLAWIENELILIYHFQRKAFLYFGNLILLVIMIVPFFARIEPTGIEFYDFLSTLFALWLTLIPAWVALLVVIQERAKKRKPKPLFLFAPYVNYKVKVNGAKILQEAAEQRAQEPLPPLSEMTLKKGTIKNRLKWWQNALVVLAVIGVIIVYMSFVYNLYGESLSNRFDREDADWIINHVYEENM